MRLRRIGDRFQLATQGEPQEGQTLIDHIAHTPNLPRGSIVI